MSLKPPIKHVVFLAGKDYREYLEKLLHDQGISTEVPMEGLGLGQQKAWLKANIPYE